MIQHSRPSLGNEEVEALQRVILRGHLAAGEETRRFEAELAHRFQRKHVVAVNSGVSALHLCLEVLGVQRGDQVICPSYCCSAPLNAIENCGAEPILVDTPHQGIALDARAPIPEAKAVIAAQMFGHVQDLSGLPSHCTIEDGAMAVNSKALSQGRLAITSFYATKMMTTGQGGAILTDDADLAETLRDLIRYDNRETYRHRFNYAPTDLGSAIGRVQLGKLDGFLRERGRCIATYDDALAQRRPELLALPGKPGERDEGLFRYWVRVANLEACISELSKVGIEAKAPVFQALHRYFDIPDVEFPHASTSREQVLSLPLYPTLKEEDQNHVVEHLCRVAIACD